MMTFQFPSHHQHREGIIGLRMQKQICWHFEFERKEICLNFVGNAVLNWIKQLGFVRIAVPENQRTL